LYYLNLAGGWVKIIRMVKKIYVTKYDGTRQAYDQRKVLNSILRAGVRRNEVTKILAQVESQLYNNIPTAKLYQIVAAEIEKQASLAHSDFYRLREALAKIGPTDFEKFVKRILDQSRYSCQWNQIVSGFCIEHQLDVVAKGQDNRFYMVEVKHHRNFHRESGLGTVAELWARFDDLDKGFQAGRNQYHFAAAWLVTNTKFSEHAKKYARCKGLRLTGWRFGFDGEKEIEGMEKMADDLGVAVVDKMVQKVVNRQRDV